jgi:hypothetical protein
VPGRFGTDSTAGVAGRDYLSGAVSPGSQGKGCTMADSVIFIGWTNAVRDREEASQKVFQEAMVELELPSCVRQTCCSVRARR